METVSFAYATPFAQHVLSHIGNSVKISLTSAYDAIYDTSRHIDGDHWGDAPLNDWNLVKDIVSRYVIFDNYDKEHPAVKATCENASFDPDWTCVYREDISFVLARTRNDNIAMNYIRSGNDGEGGGEGFAGCR